jgi:hypothetical protein
VFGINPKVTVRGAPAVRTSAVTRKRDPFLRSDAACSGSGKSHPDVDDVDLSNQDWINAGKFLYFFKERLGLTVNQFGL